MLPDDGGDIPAALASLVRLCDRAAADRKTDAVALVGYGPGTKVTPAMDTAIKWVTERDLRLPYAVRVDEGRFWCYRCTDLACCPPEGRPIDWAAPIAAEAVAQGLLAMSSREEVAALVAANTGPRRAAMAAAAEEARTWLADALIGLPLPQARLWCYGEGHRRLRAAIATYTAGITLTDTDAARLTVLLSNLTVRDVAWLLINAEEITIHRALWCDMTRRAVDNVEACASLAAFASYMDGNEPLARLALDRAFAVNPDYTMAGLIRDSIDGGLPVAKKWPFQTLEEHATEQAAYHNDTAAMWLQAIGNHDGSSTGDQEAPMGDGPPSSNTSQADLYRPDPSAGGTSRFED